MRMPKVGSSVHYVNRVTGRHQEATVLAASTNAVTYVCTLRLENGITRRDVLYSERPAAGTWHQKED